MSLSNTPVYLAHHGIKGQQWGKRNGPPYPLDAKDHSASEKKAGWKDSLNKTSRDSGSIRIVQNKDGSQTIPKGFRFNRVGKEQIDINQSGVLYVSHGKEDAARYIKNLGPTTLGKLFGEYGTHLQRLSAKDDISVPSKQRLNQETASFLISNKDAFKNLSDSIYSYAYNDDGNITEEDLKTAYKDPKSDKATRLSYAVSQMLGNGSYSQISKKYYRQLLNEGFDAIPDYADVLTGTSKTAMIIINTDKIEFESSAAITKDMLKASKKLVKSFGKLPMSEIIR